MSKEKNAAGVVTLTMNPALDTSVGLDRMEPEIKLRCERPRRAPGGGGINVARAVTQLGGEAVAVYPAGGHMGDELSDRIDELGVRTARVSIGETTRENIVVFERKEGDRVYRLNMPGARVTEDERRACLERVEEELCSDGVEGCVLVISGSLPPGVDPGFYAEVIGLARSRSVRAVVDTSGDALRAVARAGAYLLKPNVHELGLLVGRELREAGENEIFAAAAEVVERGDTEIVMVSMGGRGACLVSRDTRLVAENPRVEVKNEIGAGDSMVGALVLAMARGLGPKEMLAHGVAGGAAAVMTPGAELLQRSDFESIVGGVEVREVPA
ncbi:MAG: 1-phosphofructokinase family hexose kinase [Phycisphaerales bacterium]